MNYVYDIVLNFNCHLYDIYEWNINDDYTYIKKMPLLVIDKNILELLCNNQLKVDNELLAKICNKTELFCKKNKTHIKYAALFTNGEVIVGCKFNDNGSIIGKSYLLFQDEEEILECLELNRVVTFDYQILSVGRVNTNETRKEIEDKKYVETQLKIMLKNNEFDKLKYLYYECFGEKKKIITFEAISKILLYYNKLSFNIIDFISKCENKIYE